MSGSEKLIESQRDKTAFRESEEHYRAVADAATDAIITIDSDSTILIVNPTAELGRRKKQVMSVASALTVI